MSEVLHGGGAIGTHGEDDVILAEESREKRKELIDLLNRAYWMEIETVQSYIANSVNLDGVRAEEIKKSLAEDITDEIGHAQQFGSGSRSCTARPRQLEFKPEQKSSSRRRTRPTSCRHPRRHRAEQGAIDHYIRIIKTCEGVDYVTQDMVTTILSDEEGHLRLFEGFLREFEAGDRSLPLSAAESHRLRAFSASRNGVSASRWPSNGLPFHTLREVWSCRAAKGRSRRLSASPSRTKSGSLTWPGSSSAAWLHACSSRTRRSTIFSLPWSPCSATSATGRPTS